MALEARSHYGRRQVLSGEELLLAWSAPSAHSLVQQLRCLNFGTALCIARIRADSPPPRGFANL